MTNKKIHTSIYNYIFINFFQFPLMKKLIIAVAAIATAVACNTAEIVELPKNPAISFESAYVQNATRDAVDPSTTTASLEAFDVWAFMDETSGIVLVDEDVTKGASGWSYANVQYWAPGHTYYFGALAPMNSANWDLDTSKAGKLGAGVVSFTNVDGTEDLLYSAVEVSTADLKLGEGMDPVKLTFSHLLSKVKFTFKNGFATDNVSIKVKDVTMTVPAAATLDLNTADWWEGDKWVLGNEALTLQFGSVATTLGMGIADEADNERLTIPADAAYEYNVKFYVDVYMGDVLAIDNHEFTATIKDIALQMGKAYNFTATINPENLEMAPIVFEVVEVKEWVDANTPSDQVKDAELRAAAQFGGEVTLTEDIEILSPIVVKKSLIVNLNGKTLSSKSDVFEVAAGTLTINGNGVVSAATDNGEPYCAVWAYGDAVVNINGGEYMIGYPAGDYNDLIYAKDNAVINIYGGKFYNSGKENSFVLNLKDNSAAQINVYGGEFEKFNPANNLSEGPNTNFVADGCSSIQDGDWYLVVSGNYDNYTSVATIAELQAALDAATGNALIVVGADLVGDATAAQKENVNLTIDGAGYKFDGTLNIHGHNRHNGAETLTIKNVKFYTENTAAMDFIWSADSNNGTIRYAHNITLDGCSFEAPVGTDVVGMRFKQAYNLVVKNCVMNGGHSLVQNTSMTGQTFENLTVEAGRGINLQTSSLNTKVVNCNIKATKADGYGIRVDAGATSSLAVSGSTIEAYEPIYLRKAKASYELSLLNNTLIATNGYEIVVEGETPVISGAAGLNIKK